ncbi:uncharacterized protein PSFLO_01910 [Pseudozyma flocculosa]|uniref:Uncharacterized protein n=1 Tax=Pseudozyma flocculosa TaxID=84751 RepID=A0A5C3EZ55_9BASI|nr:uncharacterized protein PSFLO_01910 [Pseudozyma flocculosa]
MASSPSPLPATPSSSSTTSTTANAGEEGYLSAFVPTMLTDLVQSAADLVHQASEMVQQAHDMMVGPPAPVGKEAPPVPERSDSSASQPAPASKANDDTTPRASRIKQPAPTAATEEPADAAEGTDAPASKRSSILSVLTTKMLNLGSVTAEPETGAAPATSPASAAAPSPAPGSPSVSRARPLHPLRTASPAPSTSSTVSRQLTAEGTPFSDDPLISAMQRIPDGPSSASSVSLVSSSSSFARSASPSSPYSLQKSDTFSSIASSVVSTDDDGVERCQACSCRRGCRTWHLSLPPPAAQDEDKENKATAAATEAPAQAQAAAEGGGKSEDRAKNGDDEADAAKPHTCPCNHHLTKLRKRTSSSHHFHRIQQVVKGTKRVARDIRNVL